VIQQERINKLNAKELTEGQYVLYWMQQAQRAEYNHALEHAIARANELDQPVLVGFGLMDDYPEANLRHYKFMLEGIKEAQESLDKRGITMVVCQGSPDDVALGLGKQASLIV
jgi:deoxyribodipyrimidine photo-lyase